MRKPKEVLIYLSICLWEMWYQSMYTQECCPVSTWPDCACPGMKTPAVPYLLMTERVIKCPHPGIINRDNTLVFEKHLLMYIVNYLPCAQVGTMVVSVSITGINTCVCNVATLFLLPYVTFTHMCLFPHMWLVNLWGTVGWIVKFLNVPVVSYYMVMWEHCWK